MRRVASPVIVGIIAALGCVLAIAQGSNFVARDHPAIQYSTRPSHDAVARLNERLEKSELRFAFEGPSGYLRSVLALLDISPSSQTLVFSENSLQRAHISKATPRAIYFNDTVAVGWTKGAESLEVAAQDATQGVVFYSLSQKQQARPQFVRSGECLQCHLTAETSGVPGLFMMSVLPLSDDQNDYARGWAMDHRTPVEDRWGGWYVTGTQVPLRHLGNVPVSARAPLLCQGRDRATTEDRNGCIRHERVPHTTQRCGGLDDPEPSASHDQLADAARLGGSSRRT